MKEITITRAMAALKINEDKIAKRRQFQLAYLIRESDRVDPIRAEGGSEGYIQRLGQSINDLIAERLAVKRAIAVANMRHELTLPMNPAAPRRVTRSIHDWLVWRNQIAKPTRDHLIAMAKMIQQARFGTVRDRLQSFAQRRSVTEAEDAKKDIAVNIDEEKLNEEIELITHILQELDGELSQFNATHTVKVGETLDTIEDLDRRQ